MRQHATFRRALTDCGAKVTELPFVHGAYDSVFSKDNAIVVERPDGRLDALVAAPRHVERRAEQLGRVAQLRALGMGCYPVRGEHLEGGDVVMVPDGTAFMGHGLRTSPGAAHPLRSFLRRAVVPIALLDPRFYHLDMALSVLDDGTALVCAEALGPAGMRAVEGHPAVRDVVRVGARDALHFAANLVQVRHHIVLGAGAPQTEAELVARGYRVHAVPLDQFHRAGGSAACLVARVHRPPRAAMVGVAA